MNVRMPKLEVLALQATRSALFVPVADQFPALTSLLLCRVLIPWNSPIFISLSALSLNSLSDISLLLPLDICLNILEACPQLEWLSAVASGPSYPRERFRLRHLVICPWKTLPAIYRSFFPISCSFQPATSYSQAARQEFPRVPARRLPVLKWVCTFDIRITSTVTVIGCPNEGFLISSAPALDITARFEGGELEASNFPSDILSELVDLFSSSPLVAIRIWVYQDGQDKTTWRNALRT